MTSNRVALITGASRGIGKAITLALAEGGLDVVINFARQRDAAAQVQAEASRLGVKAGLLQADISQIADHGRVFEFLKEKFGRLDVLINNAGVAPKVREDMLNASEESFDRLMNTNLRGPYFLTQRLARWMVELRQQVANYSPVIVNISSISAYTSSPNRADYCLTKAGVAMMTQLYAHRLAEFEIPVFEIRPGIIETDMTAGVKEKYDRLIAEGLTPIPRWGKPEDVGKAAAAIVQGCFPYSTGEVFNVDGGFHLRRL
ncbi:MAG: 3-ketoacyl-ACP reductase [Acidobacteria bacterium]|nr:3-ketoacyl-ACP reductase [Acidobacteriota bacterium]MCI0624353.1 3-ketoacyl-ACP reductase [Acidobacteriota bacterium]MCI0718868.1 3-ketoacyl-ACP reductase [Acidobacteriota bacterium]